MEKSSFFYIIRKKKFNKLGRKKIVSTNKREENYVNQWERRKMYQPMREKINVSTKERKENKSKRKNKPIRKNRIVSTNEKEENCVNQ